VLSFGSLVWDGKGKRGKLEDTMGQVKQDGGGKIETRYVL